MKLLRLSLFLLRRERASGEWRLLLLALIIGVGSVSTTGFLADRVQRAMGEEGANFLGADLLLTSPRPVSNEIIGRAERLGLQQSRALEFATMLGGAENFQLASVRAVDSVYPLRGQVRIATQALAAGEARAAMPARGEIYADAELLTLLKVQVGDSVRIGEAAFRLAGVVADEPGRLGGVFGLAPRVFMRADEVDRTQVLLPGSRVSHLYQFAGAHDVVDGFLREIKPRLDPSQRLVGTRDGVETLRGAYANAERYLQLTALISLLLAVLAIALAAQRHARRHYDQTALLRCMGARATQLRTLYGVQWLTVGLVGGVLGVLLGALMQQLLAGLMLSDSLDKLPNLSIKPAMIAVLSGLLALSAASLPALLSLLRVSPLRVLRRDLPPLPVSGWLIGLTSAGVLLALIAWYAQSPQLTALFVGILLALAAFLAVLARLALWMGRGLQGLGQGALQFGLAQMLRHRSDSTVQLGAFTLALFLVALLALVRTGLLDSWRAQLPAEAPNHFLINIAPHQLAEVEAFLMEHKLKASALYPMVRGRLVERNGKPVAETLPESAKDSNTLRRELNLTWTGVLPDNNQVLSGSWHGAAPSAEISIESGMAERLHLALGDRLGFQVGDQRVEARVSSVRKVKWDSMQPNFFVIFAPGQIENLPYSAMAGVYVPVDKKEQLAQFVRRFPGVTVLALDKLIADIEAVFKQIASAVQILLGFLVGAGIAVVVASLLASLDARRQEAVLLRTLGARRRWLATSLWSEFMLLGFLAGLLASLCAEVAMTLIGERLFEMRPEWHPELWLVLPPVGALLVGLSGWLTTRHILRVPPMQSLRALD